MMEELLIFFFPLGIFGIYKLMQMLVERMKVRKGFFRVIFRMSNHRKLVKWMKPEKTYIKAKDAIYPFSDSSGFIYYSSTTPEVEYDLHGNQINFQKKDLTATIDPKGLSTLAKRMFNLGKKQATKKNDFVFILTLVAAGASVMTLLLLWGMMGGMAI